jgi:hypothetical protein
MPTYTLDVKLFSTVEVDAASLKDAIAALRAGIGSGEVWLGRWADGSPIPGSAELDDEDPDVLDVEGEGVAECADCGGRCGESDLQRIRHLTERVLPGEPMPAGECPDCGALCHLVVATGSGSDGDDTSRVPASVHSDDWRFEANFDAAAWMSVANDEAIRALHGIGFRGDYAADEVALYFEHTNAEIAAVLEYCRASQAGGREGVGFECVVEEEEAMAWLEQHRPTLHVQLCATDAGAPG